jgi:hypothetical protein
MRPSPRSTLLGLARAGRVGLLWLALALAAAHSIAAWHSYSHDPAEGATQSLDQKHAASDICGVCVAVAGLGGGATASPTWHLERFAQPAPEPVRVAAPHPAPRRCPYAIRAPPVLFA